MPITPLHPVRRISQQEFKELSYAVIGEVFKIHNEYGRFFDERIYKCELACRFPGVELEFPITATHATSSRTYFLDALVGNGGAFEFKAVNVLTPRHRGQLYNYLLLLDLAHRKLVNMRRGTVEHEFVNATIRADDRYKFEIAAQRWNRSLKGSDVVFESLIDLLHDWGTGLELGMYEAALMDFLGGEEKVLRGVTVRSDERIIGRQPMRLAGDDIAFRLTGFESGNGGFEDHARRLLRHVDLRAFLWLNISLQRVTFTSLE